MPSGPSVLPPTYIPHETMVGYAERVLRAADEPIHILDLIDRMLAGGFPQRNRKDVRDSLQRTIDRKIKRGSGPFVRAGSLGVPVYTVRPPALYQPTLRFNEEGGSASA